MFDFKSLKSWFNDYANQLKKIRADIEALEIQRENVLFAPTVQADVRANLVGWIESQRTAYQIAMQNKLTSFADNRQLVEDPTLASRFMLNTPFMSLTNAYGGNSNEDTNRALAGLFGDLLIQSIDATLSQIEWPKEGLSSAERTRRVAELEKKLDALKAEEHAFVSAANDTGIRVEAIE